MNGVSFSEFENSSFETLYNNGFANARDFDKAAKDMKPGDWMPKELANGDMRSLLSSANGGARSRRPVGAHYNQLPTTSAPTVRAAAQPRAIQPSQAPASGMNRAALPNSVPARQSVPLNDMGVMPGNTRVDHAWKPSHEAHARAQLAPSIQAAPRAIAAPAGSGNQGTFVGWKSN
mmetsp:Transcript_91626/g.163081  ORF Transcript_91626/g.163081 Transcript_91626/m.163081 type:complete len:176 (-) Transcript_91626:63-590(-)